MFHQNKNVQISIAAHVTNLSAIIFIIFVGTGLACVALHEFHERPILYSLGQASSLTEFVAIIEKYKEPKGILPDLFIPALRRHKLEGDFVYSSTFTSYEFFVFDRRRVLLLLSVGPLSFIEIESPLFYGHCLEQLEQIRAGQWGKRKVISTAPFLKLLGDLNLEIYFSPTEINYASRGPHLGRMRQTGMQKPPMDLWRLFAAAQKITAYFPDYTDQRMHTDIQEQRARGKIRSILSSHLDLNAEAKENIPEYLEILAQGPSFAYIHGEELELTQDLLGDTSLDYVDSSLLLKDFLFLFSLSPAENLAENSGLTSGNKNYLPALNYKDGLVLLLRGNQRALEPFLSFITKLMQNSKSALELPALLISEIGNQKNANLSNDYVLLHNPNDFPLALAGLYLGRDSGCNLENGWSEYKPLASQWIESRGYFLISREGNDLNADWIWNGSIGERYCIVLSASALPPTSLDDSAIVDSVSFDDLANKSSYRRKGSCQEQNSQRFADDFFKINDATPPRNKQSEPCI